MNESFQNELTQKIAGFLNEIGIETIPSILVEQTFLPGILVKDGKLLVDEKKLAFPGDLLHEAGHLAVAPARLRAYLNDEVSLPDETPELLETQAMLWSYAACVYLKIDPRVVFHEGGYRGQSENLLFNLSLGIYAGLNGLEDFEMAFSETTAGEIGVPPFPQMHRWLRD